MSPEAIDRAACSLNTYIPHHRVIFHNIRSLSLYADKRKEHARFKRVTRHLGAETREGEIYEDLGSHYYHKQSSSESSIRGSRIPDTKGGRELPEEVTSQISGGYWRCK